MKYKLSYYTLFIDPADDIEKQIVFSARSGRSLVISKYFHSLLINGRFSEIPNKSLQSLIDVKAIVPIDENELRVIIDENKEKATPSKLSGILYEVIQPTASCQLGCYYCGQSHSKDNISSTLYAPLVSRIEGKLSQGNYNSLYIGWFGAEPLMGLHQMRDLTEYFKSLCYKRNMSYNAKVVTNGLSLKKEIYDELIAELGVNKIEVTLDGIAEFHDQHRGTKKGKGSFNAIFNNLKSILLSADYDSKKCPISIRCNVDAKNKDGVVPLMKLFANTGLHKKIDYFYTVGIYSWGGNDAQHGSLTKDEFAKKEVEWMVEKYKLGFPVVDSRITPGRKKSVCMAVSESPDMYDAFGNIFSCTEVSYSPVYNNSYLFSGNLHKPEEIKFERPLTKWNDEVLAGEFPCHSCKILPVCGGCCPKSWHEKIPACPPMKFNLEEKLRLGYIFNKSIPESIEPKLGEFLKELAIKKLSPL